MPLALRGVLASPTRGQKSSLRLIAQQTAAEAEQNANVALLERQAKKVQGERLSVAAAGSCGCGGGQVAHRGDLGGSLAPQPCFCAGGNGLSLGGGKPDSQT